MPINAIDEEKRIFWENFIEDCNKRHSLQIEKLEHCNQVLVENTTLLEVRNNKCFRCIKHINYEVSRLEKEEGV